MRTITEDAGSLASATVVAGVGAAVVSLVQCALGLLLIWVTAVGISLGGLQARQWEDPSPGGRG